MEPGHLIVWAEFFGCVLAIGLAGTRLSFYGDILAEKTGLSGNWIGLVLLATATSLPELITGVTSVTIANAPNITIGDVLGSCVFNLSILVVVDFLSREASIYQRARQGHILSAAYGIALIAFVGVNLMIDDHLALPTIGHIGLYSPAILLLYFIAMRSIFLYEREQVSQFVGDVTERYPAVTLQGAAVGYLVTAGIVATAGVALPFVATDISRLMGWSNTFVGTLLVAATTSLPELAVTVGAVRLGAIDMAIANLLGSNLFDIVIIAVDDLVFLRGPILSHVSPIHSVSALSAVIMSSLAIIGLFGRTGTRVFGTVGWISLGLFAIYVLNSLGLYLAHE